MKQDLRDNFGVDNKPRTSGSFFKTLQQDSGNMNRRSDEAEARMVGMCRTRPTATTHSAAKGGMGGRNVET
jgi:hypothetical protein